jgi:hypothetical protein
MVPAVTMVRVVTLPLLIAVCGAAQPAHGQCPAAADHTFWFMLLPQFPVFAPLHGDAHFVDLVRRLRLAS